MENKVTLKAHIFPSTLKILEKYAGGPRRKGDYLNRLLALLDSRPEYQVIAYQARDYTPEKNALSP